MTLDEQAKLDQQAKNAVAYLGLNRYDRILIVADAKNNGVVNAVTHQVRMRTSMRQVDVAYVDVAGKFDADSFTYKDEDGNDKVGYRNVRLSPGTELKDLIQGLFGATVCVYLASASHSFYETFADTARARRHFLSGSLRYFDLADATPQNLEEKASAAHLDQQSLK